MRQDGREHDTDDPQRTRRALLGLTATATAGLLAGCSGGGDGGGSDGGDNSGETTSGAPGNGSGDSAGGSSNGNSGSIMDGSDGGSAVECPSTPLSYKTLQGEGDPAFTVDIPEGAAGEKPENTIREGNVYSVNYDQAIGNAGFWTVSIAATEEAATVDASVEAANTQILTEVTSEYDLAVGGARAFASDIVPDRFVIFLPGPGGAIKVATRPSVGSESPGICTDAAKAVMNTVVETVQPA